MSKTNFLALIVLICVLYSFSLQAQTLHEIKSIETLEGDQMDFQHLLKDNRIVFVFYSVDCPLCKKYTRTLNLIQDEFQDDIRLFTVFSGEHQRKKKIRKFIKKYELSVEALLDPEYNLVDALEAKITPESFFLDNGEIAYRGALDDWVIKLGSTKSEVRHPYLKDAIKASIEDREIAPKSMKAIGCFIR